MKPILLLPIFFGLFTLSMIVVWMSTSYNTFPRQVMPGNNFTVGDKEYKIPIMPHKTFQSKESASVTKPIPVLSEKMLLDLRNLIEQTFGVMRNMKVPFWVTGGTLISAILWGYLMPYDDDADVSILFRDKDKLWNQDFFEQCKAENLEVFVMRGVTKEYAPTKEMSALRVRKKGSYGPVIDIFFLDWDEEQNRWAHVNGWNKDQIYFDHKNEVWEKEWLLPLQDTPVDGMIWPIPAQPEKMLTKHYGAEWKTVIKSPSPLFKSHQWAFWVSNTFGAWKVLNL